MLVMQLCGVVLVLGIVGCVGGQGGYWWLGKGAFGEQEDIQGDAKLGEEGDIGLLIQDISGNFDMFFNNLHILMYDIVLSFECDAFAGPISSNPVIG